MRKVGAWGVRRPRALTTMFSLFWRRPPQKNEKRAILCEKGARAQGRGGLRMRHQPPVQGMRGPLVKYAGPSTLARETRQRTATAVQCGGACQHAGPPHAGT